MASVQRTYRVILERKAEKQLRDLTKADFQRVSNAIEKIAQNPRGHNSIKLTDSQNEYRYRAGNLRILYTIEDKVLHVYIFEIVDRRDAYK